MAFPHWKFRDTENILNILIKIQELRDHYTTEYSKRVTKLSIAIAREL